MLPSDHPDTVAHLALQLGLTAPVLSDDAHRTKSVYRYQTAVRAHLSVTLYGDAAEELVARTTLEHAEIMSDPADLINRAVDAVRASASLANKPGKACLMDVIAEIWLNADRAHMLQAFNQTDHGVRLGGLRHLPQPGQPVLAGLFPPLYQCIEPT